MFWHKLNVSLTTFLKTDVVKIWKKARSYKIFIEILRFMYNKGYKLYRSQIKK